MGHMAAAPQHLSLEEFDRLYGHDQKPYYEYWFGQAIQKPVPNIIHSLLQAIMAILLREIGLLSGPE
jgi:Uma2 family endonuclease